MTDHLGNPLSPSDQAVVVVTSSSSDSALLGRTKYLYVGSAGSLVVVMATDGATVTFPTMNSGTMYPLAVSQVLKATTASNIVACY